MVIERYLTEYICRDLVEKMVFVGGARQVGKTTLAKKLIAGRFNGSAYFNWDNRQDRKKIMQSEYPGSPELIIFDEIHKYKKWKNHIKGEYDAYKDTYKFLITGSARLDIYRKGGDSLQGRYHYYRLHPLSLPELIHKKNTHDISGPLEISSGNHHSEFEALFHFGGFPEILLKQDSRALRRWHNEKIERLFREDVRDLFLIKDLASMRLLSDILPEKAGSLLSVNSLREDLEVSHRAVTSWLDILEAFFYHFRIYPFNKKAVRSIKKEPKLYLYDWSEVENEAARFENMIASHLLKLVHFLYDYEGYKAELFFLRNVDKKELDFLVVVDGKPWFCVEVKLNETSLSPHMQYFRERLRIPHAYQVVKQKGVDIVKHGCRIISADRFLASLL
jgi:predicted AAA+ superfamily ATPase